MMAVTIKDVARETNLAISTISKYMNGGNVRGKNRKLIEEAVQRLGYRPNNAARGLRSSRSFLVGLILDGLDNQFFSPIASQITERLNEQGYHVIVCCHRDSIKKARKSVDFMLENQVDGMILLPLSSDEDYLESARINRVPVVTLDRLEMPDFDMVGSNAAVGSYNAVEYLIQQGHRKIAVLSGTDKKTGGLKAGQERLKGYKRALEDYMIPLKEEYIASGDFSFSSGYEGMKRIWQLKDRPTAIFISNYNMTLGAVTLLHNLGIAIPEELSLVSFDDLEFSELCQPNLTAVRQPAEEIAKESVDLLLKRMQGDYTNFPEYRKLPAKLFIRDSVRAISRNAETAT
ncbi:LacI family DNA-binding transcriptional regulator [Faecalicatena orotica]|nr:LacI family DNA-binding transcriptional regulator [Faecalicatena orotica]